jgi:hypothetical protein
MDRLLIELRGMRSQSYRVLRSISELPEYSANAIQIKLNTMKLA